MEQLCFFPEAGQSKGLPSDFLEYFPGLISMEAGNRFLQQFIAEVPWKQTTQKLWDKEYLTPRLTCWYGETEKIAGTLPLTPELLMIKQMVEPLVGVAFNSVLLNYYRDGNDSVAWHSDKAEILGRNPVIASVSFGQVRSFDIRNKTDHKEHYSVRLEHGSFLLMKAGLQENWEHRIAKSTRPMGPRINLTFRVVK
jgi:alkylated DNA repair dioxygenase AlkB